MVRLIATFVGKAALIYLLMLIVWVDLVLIVVAIPRLIFEEQPFFQSAGLALVIATAISIGSKSRNPLLWAVFFIAYSSLFLLFSRYAFKFIAFFVIVGAISFFYRSRFTEPLLVLLPIISGAWLFIMLVYSAYFTGWLYYVTNQESFAGALYQGLASLGDRYLYLTNVLPIMATYFLAKRGYVKVYSLYRARRPNPSINQDATR